MLGVLFVIFAGLLWALDTLIRYPLLFGGVSAERIVLTEHLFLTIIFLPILYKNKLVIWQSKISSIFYFSFIGILGSAVGTLCFTKAFMMINPSLVILMQKLQPVIAISLASFILGEKIQKPFYFWAFVAIVGGVLISSEDILPWFVLIKAKLNTQGASQSFLVDLLSEKAIKGYLLTLVAVVSWGCSTVFGKKLTAQGFNESQLMGGRFTFGFIFLIFYSLANKNLIQLDWQMIVWGKILAMVIISGLLGMYFYYKGLKSISARVCALAEMFFPLSAVAINWIVLGAKLTTMQLIGAGLLTLGSTVIQLRNY